MNINSPFKLNNSYDMDDVATGLLVPFLKIFKVLYNITFGTFFANICLAHSTFYLLSMLSTLQNVSRALPKSSGVHRMKCLFNEGWPAFLRSDNEEMFL